MFANYRTMISLLSLHQLDAAFVLHRRICTHLSRDEIAPLPVGHNTV